MIKSLLSKWAKLAVVMVLIVACAAEGTGMAFAAASVSSDEKVDFQKEEDRKLQDLSISGSGSASFYDTVEVPGIEKNNTDTDKDETQEQEDDAEESGTEQESDSEEAEEEEKEEDNTAGENEELSDLEYENSEEQKNQLDEKYLSADGNTYQIEVIMDDRESVDGELDLSVDEILKGTDCYEDYLYSASEYMFLESVDDIDFARFFDIKILKNGKKYEPEYPVQVKIKYQDAVEVEGDQQMSIVHFASAGPEVIQDVEVSKDGTELTYEQNGFSVTGTVVSSNNIQDGHQYVIYTSRDSNYYAMTHYSEGRDADVVYAAQINASATAVTEQNLGSSIVWTAHKVTVGGKTYYTFSYEEGGETYYLRSYGGLMVGADSEINENGYRDASRYQWSIDNKRLRNRYSNNNDNRYLRFSYSANAFKERDNGSSDFYFADVSSYTQDVEAFPTIHYVDESGNPLTVVNGRNWETDSATTPAFLIYDIDGYDYVKTTRGSVSGSEIRPILRKLGRNWQYTESVEKASSIPWNTIPEDQDIYVVYKKSTEPVTGGTPKVKESAATEDPVDPAIHKSSVSNHDGTNTLSLSITADTSPLEVEKLADVIVIFDTSNSMRRQMGTNTTMYHDENTPASQQGDKKTRLYIGANAINDLAETLIGNNTTFKDSAGNKLIRMSLISFNRSAKLEQGFTEDITTYKNKVNGLTTNSGTNWEAALRTANQLEVDPERATFVIFVTDGNPSYRIARGNTLKLDGYPDKVYDGNVDVYGDSSYYIYRTLQNFGALDEEDERNFSPAVVDAQSIVSHNKNLYCIGIGNSAGITRLQGLTSQAYNNETIGADRTKTADNEAELTQAFKDITASIVALLGWGDITMTDGITSLANTVEKSHLVNVDGNFEYWKADAPEGWDGWSKRVRAGYILGTSGEAISYPEGYNDWPASEKTQYVAAYNQGKNIPADKFKPWNPAIEKCNEAEYDESTASVKWDMGHSFVPEAGCTYKVSFRVWPSQEAYDILANLKNGTVKYEDLTDSQKAQIIDLGNGSYSLKTNDKEPKTTYKAARKTGDGVTTSGEFKDLFFNDVDPMPLVPEKLTVRKDWDYDLGDTHKATSLDFRLMVGDKYYQNDGSFDSTTNNAKLLPVSESVSWTNSVNVAAGIVIFDTDGSYELLETGHDYKLEECNIVNDGTPIDASYEFTSQTVRPMVLTVKGSDTYRAKLTYLVKIDENNPAVPGNDIFKIGNDTYYAASTSSDGTVVGTNHRKSELDITKLIVDKTGKMTADELDAETFTYRVTLTVPKDTDCSQMTAYEFVYRADDDPRLNGNKPFPVNGYQDGDGFIEGEDKSGAHYRSYTIKKGNASIADSFTMNSDDRTKSMTMDVTLNRKEVLRFTNLPTGTTYSIQEMYANYRQADPSRDADATGSSKASNLSEQGYTTTYKTKSTTDTDAVSGTGTTITGEITDVDIRYYNQFTNTLEQAADAELKVTKALDGFDWATGDRYFFKLEAINGAPLPSGAGSNTGRTQFYISSTTPDHTYTFGKIRYTEAGTYKYTITETDSSWNSVAGQLINGIQYAPVGTITVTVAQQDRKLVVTDISGSSNSTVTSAADGSSLVVGTTTITNSSVTLSISKIDSKTEKQLAGAVFELRKDGVKLYLDSTDAVLTAEQVAAIIGMPVTDEGADQKMAEAGIRSSFEIGEITLRGLALDTEYTLYEANAPDGYIITSSESTFKLTKDSDGTHVEVSGSSASVDNDGITLLIENEPGPVLPHTGGPGTRLIYLFGFLLAIMSGAALVIKKRMELA